MAKAHISAPDQNTESPSKKSLQTADSNFYKPIGLLKKGSFVSNDKKGKTEKGEQICNKKGGGYSNM